MFSTTPVCDACNEPLALQNITLPVGEWAHRACGWVHDTSDPGSASRGDKEQDYSGQTHHQDHEQSVWLQTKK